MIPKAKMLDISDENLANLRSRDFSGFIKLGCQYADVVVKANENLDANVDKIVNETAEKQIEALVGDENVTETFFKLYTELAE